MAKPKTVTIDVGAGPVEAPLEDGKYLGRAAFVAAFSHAMRRHPYPSMAKFNEAFDKAFGKPENRGG